MISKKNFVLIAFATLWTFSVKAQTTFPSFADLVEKLLPSVVNISTTTLNEDGQTDATPETETLGSGFILSKDGYIVTNYHVINHAKTINITLYNNEKTEAEIIGEDAKTDLALLKINTQTELSPVIFGDSDALRVIFPPLDVMYSAIRKPRDILLFSKDSDMLNTLPSNLPLPAGLS